MSGTDDVRSHLELIVLAREIRHAARVADVDRVHTSLCRLQSALMVHVHAERRHISELAPPARSVLLRGQTQLLGLVDRLLYDSVETAGGCTCLGGALDLSRHLARQARLELRLGVPPVI